MFDFFSRLSEPVIVLSGAAAFFLVLSGWLIFTTLVYLRRVRSEHRISERLHRAPMLPTKEKTLRLWHNGRVGTTTVLDYISPGRLTRWLERTRTGLGWGGPLPTFALFLASILFLGFVLLYGISQNLLVGAGWVLLCPIVLNFIATRRVTKEAAIFEQQLADALALATRSLRAGHPLMSAFQVIIEEMEPPVSHVFAEIVQSQQLGTSLEESILRIATKSDSDDLKLFAASTVIQLRSGGNLADMMERLVAVIRDRIRLQRRVRILTAQTQFSKRVLIAMPFVLIGILLVLKPDYLEPMWTTQPGRYMLGAAGIFIIFGSWVMNKIAILKY
jgi:tight adherence protein B